MSIIFHCFANNESLDTSSFENTVKDTDYGVFFNHGLKYSSIIHNSVKKLYWFTRNYPAKKGSWKNKINGGLLIPDIKNVDLFIGDNCFQNDNNIITDQRNQIKVELNHDFSIVSEKIIKQYYDISDYEYPLSTGCLGTLYFNYIYPTAEFHLWGFNKRNLMNLKETHNYKKEENLMIEKIGERLFFDV